MLETVTICMVWNSRERCLRKKITMRDWERRNRRLNSCRWRNPQDTRTNTHEPVGFAHCLNVTLVHISVGAWQNAQPAPLMLLNVNTVRDWSDSVTATALLLVSLVVVVVFALAASKPSFARCGQRDSPSSSFWSLCGGGELRKKGVVVSGGINWSVEQMPDRCSAHAVWMYIHRKGIEAILWRSRLTTVLWLPPLPCGCDEAVYKLKPF